MRVNEDKISPLYDAIELKSLLVVLCFNIIVLTYEIAPRWRVMTVAQATVTAVYVATTVMAMTGNFSLGPIAGLALSTCWLAFSIGKVLTFGFVNELAFKAAASTLTARGDDEGQAKLTCTPITPEIMTSKHGLMNQIIQPDITESFLSLTVLTKESQREEKHEPKNSITDTLSRHDSWPKVGVTLGLVLLAAILLPVARAETTRIIMPGASLTLPAPTPHVTIFSEVTSINTANSSVNGQEKDKPQTWFYHPNSSQRTSTNPLMMLLPLIVIGYLVLPSFAVETQKKNIEDANFNNLSARAFVSKESQISTTDSSATMDIPPTFGVPTLGMSTTDSSAHATLMSPCGKSNCPSGTLHRSIGSRKEVLEAALLAVGAGFAMVIAFVV